MSVSLSELLRLRRKPQYPYVLEERRIHIGGHLCECCRSRAVITLALEMSALREPQHLMLCADHYGMAKRRMWPELFRLIDRRADTYGR